MISHIPPLAPCPYQHDDKEHALVGFGKKFQGGSNDYEAWMFCGLCLCEGPHIHSKDFDNLENLATEAWNHRATPMSQNIPETTEFKMKDVRHIWNVFNANELAIARISELESQSPRVWTADTIGEAPEGLYRFSYDNHGGYGKKLLEKRECILTIASDLKHPEKHNFFGPHPLPIEGQVR